MYRKLLKTLFFFFVSSYSFGQVGIGTDQPRGALEINSSTNGFVPPQVALTSSNASAPVVNPQGGGAPVTGTIVYNTATAGTAPNNVVPGFYYWNGSSWLLLTSQASSGASQWALTGNMGTSASTNFVGTTDAADFVTRTNNTERMRLLSNGNLGIGTASPTAKLDVAAGVTGRQTLVNATGNINDFLQFNVQNTSSGLQAQSGYSATANNGTATSGFAWMGINNSGFNFPTAYNIGGANDVSYVGSGQDMHIANANNTKSIIFSTGTALTPFFNERMRITNAGNVGIGTTNPTTKLHINSTGSPALRIVDGSEGSGKMLVSDANGNATWQSSNLPLISAFQGMIIPICANVSVNSTGSFVTTISGVNTTVTWTVLSKQTSNASFPISAERLQVRYNFSPQLPFNPKGIIFNALNNSGYPDTFSLNYAAKSQSSITVNITRNDTLGNGTVSCWAGQFYFDVMVMN
ncbi:hypothetical protein B0A78_05545 [Flavobacterium columnare NBRC 100251 = ATCC 23463]|nr:hypothetical protein [Flavobacterium columnare]ANO47992.1 hypothetical protein Pf1_02538 [Flavobacterium columnare]APT21430.1 hypothetical protein BU993_01500 [Flavobacterium columnare]MBF6651666.1 hypothetical protein [Flavobacterium columnare]MBF6654749.1 hypothetical protein [Flavobacterium columnare]MBF6657404.1 hypothetical protein [Flavobacterium columnare]